MLNYSIVMLNMLFSC